ncbi:hypothetical protein UCRPC4_g06136 [Phaeomoniella chlamydospora]|uniref:BTB domain-containing protein n=1 Tax=Phaeomoniella chlamydospora TaxID=158046 RepID=A0A0G2FV58_PHACM|nr:hypothetical protein UCRPC4_g06136 [Phaeomoniella chlamydospora]
MAEPEVQISPEPDVEMAGAEESEVADVDDRDVGGAAGEGNGDSASSPHSVFLDYLKSPIVELVVGSDNEQTTITAHSAILAKSPWFAAKIRETPTAIEMHDEALDAVACFLQYQYTGEYFPRRSSTSPDGLEHDPSAPDVDDTGDQLLKHARVYTLAGKLGLPDLKTLAHSKIHRINSSAKGEIAYARYVYGNTPSDDTTIRKPVAAFWATRSHVLRHEAEKEFREMCIQYPQFGFDVLTLVLDQRERKSAREGDETVTPAKSGRKRLRTGA